MNKATLAGGCFWCLESAFNRLEGVQSAISGYTGGHTPDPSYREVCDGTTGHAEAVEVTFDPTVLSYRDLLTVFFALHDPTTPNRQGHDVGTQYRSAIFFHNEAQRQEAATFIAELENQGVFDAPIVTQLAPAGTFYPAEDYHQGYYDQNRGAPYCQAIIAPKLAKLRQSFPAMLRRDGPDA
ncbi:peptide-methionine (S)-S-oxide reductase MsrA [Pseudogulbenkiania sp. MAI-1]|uniref:peptide-methionine (S)-S-oxide reductase MsrA n=1 Tax=Pseudogulbenkiania sp. MAI-1 TaxID=990370 RepID=UPI00045E95E1|nr:peptide-methionine (S)-S-oxide reductase MsrA [Pseudogulbenkiania sp. MAI-1]